MTTAPSSDNYTLGRGRLAFNRKVDGVFQGLRDLGNATDFSITTSTEKKEHYGSRKGLKVKDKSVVVSMSINGKFTLDEIVPDNLAMALMASVTKVVQTAAQEETQTFTASSKKGGYLQLADYFIDPTEANFTLTVELAAKTMGTDFTVDGPSGQIFILPGSTIADGSTCVVTYDTLAKTYWKLNAFNSSSVEGELHFISDNPVGANIHARIWNATISPSGDIGLISDDWSSLAFELELGDDSANHALFPYMEVVTF